jgi:hypothetical protein
VFINKWLDDWEAERTVKSEIKKAEDALREIEDAPHSTEDAKKEARSEVESLRLLRLALHSGRVHAIVRNRHPPGAA